MPNAQTIKIDRAKSLLEEPSTGHNRWHPDIQAVLKVAPGDLVILETRDALDGMVGPNTSSTDLGSIEMGRIHPLTGAIHIEGAEPGDILEVEILEVEPQPFGFTLLMPGFGMLRDYFPDPFVVTWEIANGVATSSQLPGIRIPGAPFMGVMGVAPSHDLFQLIQAREDELQKKGGAVLLPTCSGAVPSTEPIATTGLRTIPPRENGGNIDIRHLTAGTTAYFPVFVSGALFSAGDAHFAQGDCESCGTAIEMGGTAKFRFGIQKGAASPSHMRGLHYARSLGTQERLAGQGAYYATTGMPITPEGRNESEDAMLAAKNALLSMIDHLVRQEGFTREQAYVITSVAVDIHMSQLVDVPNVLVSAFLPKAIFSKNIRNDPFRNSDARAFL